MTWQFTDETQTVVARALAGGGSESRLASTLPEGEQVLPFNETAEQVISRLERSLDAHIDAVANSYRYESIRTMVTYATSDHPTFGPEGRAAVKFRDAVYAYGIQVIADVEAGNRPIPTEAELIAELPPITDFFE
jgi:hypothetical protein